MTRLDAALPASPPLVASVADAAPQLHRDINSRQDRVNRGTVDGLALEGAVQIDHDAATRNPASARTALRLRAGVVIEHRRLFHFAELEAQPNTGTVFQVDGRIQDHPSPS